MSLKRGNDMIDHLAKYAAFLKTKNTNPFEQATLTGRILTFILPRVLQAFVNSLADMIHQTRRNRFPDCDQQSDWFRSEWVFYTTFGFEGVILLAIKCVLLVAYCDCVKTGLNFPGIDGAMQDAGVNDQKVIAALEDLSEAQCDLLFASACKVELHSSTVELFLRREIAQTYFENEAEILRQFEISC